MAIWGSVSALVAVAGMVVAVIYCILERRRVLKHLGHLNRYPEVPILGSTYLIAFMNTESNYIQETETKERIIASPGDIQMVLDYVVSRFRS